MLQLLPMIFMMGSPRLVQAFAITLTANSTSPADATALVSVNNTGTITIDTNSTSPTSAGTWLLIGDPEDYEVEWEATGDTGNLTGSAINTPIDCSLSPAWTLTDSGAVGGQLEVTGLMKFSLASSGAVLASEVVTLRAQELS